MSEQILRVKTKVYNERCRPKMGKVGDAAYDLACAKDFRVGVSESAIVPLGVAFKIPYGYCGVLTHRSSMAFKWGCTVSYGLIDSSFDSEIKAKVFNHSPYTVEFKEGDRIAQIRFVPVQKTVLFEDQFESTGKVGFGSSGGYDGKC